MKPSPEAEAQNMKRGPEAATKKPYKKPAFKVYGNIEALTRTVDLNSVESDGGSGAMTKTH